MTPVGGLSTAQYNIYACIYHLGLQNHIDGDYNRAIQNFKDALGYADLPCQRDDIYFELSECYQATEQWSDAREILDKCESQDPYTESTCSFIQAMLTYLEKNEIIKQKLVTAAEKLCECDGHIDEEQYLYPTRHLSPDKQKRFKLKFLAALETVNPDHPVVKFLELH